MRFTSLTFVLFLAIVFGLYWRLKNRRSQNFLLLAASYTFYGWWDYRFLALILASSLVDFWVGRRLQGTTSDARRKQLLLVSIVFNLGLLGFFKYFNFFAESAQALAQSLGWHLSPFTAKVILPVGISFYTFQTLSYTIDVYRRRLKTTSSLLDYLTYVSFFPQLVAGPIERGTSLLPQFTRGRSFDLSAASDGCKQMLWGFFKKMVIADNLAIYVDRCYGDPSSQSGPQLALATVCFAFQIYCDFSAYSDIAIGVAKLFGIKLMRNFAFPYFSQSPGEFWRRWHISLSTWFRDYVYIPLGGNRAGRARQCFNVMATFLLSGLWHGAAWNFVLWGGFHGVILLPSVLLGRKGTRDAEGKPGGNRFIPGLATALRLVGTFAVITAGWILFRARSLSEAWTVVTKIVTESATLSSYGALGLTGSVGNLIVPLPLAILGFVLVEWVQRRQEHPLRLEGWPLWVRWGVYTGLFWGTLLLSAPQAGQFIYFQF